MTYAVLYHPRTYHEQNYRNYYVPYSILSVATMVDAVLPCVLLDNNRLRCDDPRDLAMPPPEEWVFVGVSVMIGRQIEDALRFSDYVHSVAPDCPVVWGGPCATMLPEVVLKEAPITYIVRGPGEHAARALAEALRSGGGTDVPGLYTRVGNRGISGRPPAPLDLKTVPPYRALYERVDVAHYVRPDEHIGSRTINYHSSQGCPYRCGFCCEGVLWDNRWTAFPAARIVADLLPLIDKYGVDGIKFYDSEFFIRRDRALEFARLLRGSGRRVRWGASVHPRNLSRLSDEDLRDLAASGLSRLLVGAESAIAEELALIGKRTGAEEVRQIARRCAAFGIAVCFTFVTGYPGFPLTHIDRTLEFAHDLTRVSSLHEAKVHFYAPYPGTPLFTTAQAHGFRAPTTLREWAGYDYYNTMTPWVPSAYDAIVRAFNQTHYPYLTASEVTT